MQSLVPSLNTNNLIPVTIYFSFVYLCFDKNRTPPDWQRTGPLGIGKNRTPSDWQKSFPSGLAKVGPIRIGKNRTLRIGKIGTPPDCETFGPFLIGTPLFVKIAFPVLLKFSPDTLRGTFSDAIML